MRLRIKLARRRKANWVTSRRAPRFPPLRNLVEHLLCTLCLTEKEHLESVQVLVLGRKWGVATVVTEVSGGGGS